MSNDPYFQDSPYQNYSKAELDSAELDSSTGIQLGDVVKGLMAGAQPVLFNEYYEVVNRNESYFSWELLDKDGDYQYYTGQPYEVYDPERGTGWQKINLSTIQTSEIPSTGPGTVQLVELAPLTGPNHIEAVELAPPPPIPLTGPNHITTTTGVDSDGDGVFDNVDYFASDPSFSQSKATLDTYPIDEYNEPIVGSVVKNLIALVVFSEYYNDDGSLRNTEEFTIQPGEYHIITLIDGTLNFTDPFIGGGVSMPFTGPYGRGSGWELINTYGPPASTGPNHIEVVELVISTGPNHIEVVELAPLTGPNHFEVVELVPSTGPKESKIDNLPSKGPESIEHTLLPSKGPELVTLQDSRCVPVEEIPNKTSPDKGRGYRFEGPATGPSYIKPLPNAITLEGYYPLYRDPKAANLASPNTSYHTHDFNGATYYMPNGLDRIWHGDFEGPKKGPSRSKLVEVVRGRTKKPKYISHIYDTRASALTGPFTYGGLTAITSRDNSSEVYAVNSKREVVKSTLNDLKDSEFKFPCHRINVADKFDIENEEGIVANEKGSFMYRGKYLSTPFAEAYRITGDIEAPLFFKDCYLAIAETNWIHLGSEANLKELFRVDLTFAESSLGHVWLYAINESNKVSGQYKGELRDNMKVFTNLRGKRFKIKLFIAAHKDHPWSMREMSLGYNQGKNF